MAADTQQHGQITPASAPTSKVALSDEERRQKKAQLRERLKVSRLSLRSADGRLTGRSIDGSKSGYWARKHDEGELGRLEFIGFQVVHDDVKSPRWIASGKQADGTYQVADLILMEIDAVEYELLLEENQERSKAQIVGAAETFKAEAASSKERTGYEVPTFERSK